MKAIKVIIFIILFSLILSVNLQAKKYTATISKIVDGDTVWVEKEKGKKVKLRLLGIDTPEKYMSRKLYVESGMCHYEYNKKK